MSSLTISDRPVVPSRDVAPAVGLAPESRQILLQRDLRASLGDGAGHGGMVGFGEIYFSAFALAVGLGELMAGLVASLPLLAGGIMQTISPWAIRWLGSHKRWVVCCATLQSLTFFPLMVAAYRGHLSGAGLLWIAAVYWAAGLATGPAWNTWIGTIVPRRCARGSLRFARGPPQAALFLGFLLGGVALQFASADHCVLNTFAALFAVAGISRLFSVWMLVRITEPTPIPGKMRHLTWRRDATSTGGGQRRSAADLPGVCAGRGADVRTVFHTLHAGETALLLWRVRDPDLRGVSGESTGTARVGASGPAHWCAGNCCGSEASASFRSVVDGSCPNDLSWLLADAGDQWRGLGSLRTGVLPVVFRVDRRGRAHEPADVLQPVLYGRLGERSAGGWIDPVRLRNQLSGLPVDFWVVESGASVGAAAVGPDTSCTPPGCQPACCRHESPHHGEFTCPRTRPHPSGRQPVRAGNQRSRPGSAGTESRGSPTRRTSTGCPRRRPRARTG